MNTLETEVDVPLESYLRTELWRNARWSELCSEADALAKPRSADTPREILQQPWVWRQCARIVGERLAQLMPLFEMAGQIYLTGAGSSFYVGKCVEVFLRERLGKPVTAIPSTNLILAPEALMSGREPGLVVSFSRSGGSPESFEAARSVSQLPGYQQLLITCDGSSPLARRFDETPNATVLALHRASCDRGLAMTSSFTSMVLAAQAFGFASDTVAYAKHASQLCELGSDLLLKAVQVCDQLDLSKIHRACVLANGSLNAAAMEGALKILEMTDGQVATVSDSFLGVRHGPLSFVDSNTLVIYFLSSRPSWRQYERDLMQEVKDKELGGHRIAVGCHLADFEGLIDEGVEVPISDGGLDDDLRPPLDVLLPQVIALRLSLASRLNPDNPSRRGAINRVVQGVTIHRA